MAEHEIDDDDYDPSALAALEVLTKTPVHAGECLAEEALRIALPRKAIDLMVTGPRVMIIHIPDADWAQPIATVLPRIVKSVIVKTAVERATVSKVDVPVGADALRYLQRAKSVAFISQDPSGILDPSVLAAADMTITLGPVTVTLLRKVRRPSAEIRS